MKKVSISKTSKNQAPALYVKTAKQNEKYTCRNSRNEQQTASFISSGQIIFSNEHITSAAAE
jgi:hypothetical protein